MSFGGPRQISLGAAKEELDWLMRDAVREGFLEATDVAEYLVLSGQPFRTAYQASKELVALALASKRRLPELGDAQIAASHPAFSAPGFDASALRAYLEPGACVARRSQTGGPAPERTKEELARLSAFVAAAREGQKSRSGT